MRPILAFAIAAFVLALTGAAYGQTPGQARVVTSCGAQSYTADTNAVVTMDTAGNICGNTAGGGSDTVNQGTPNAGGALAWPTTDATTQTDLGPPGATACATDTGSCSLNALLQRIASRISTLITGITNTIVLQAGGNIIGKVGVDQTTPGTTNGIAITAISASPTNTSGTIASGGTAQQLVAASATRHSIIIQNLSTDPLCFSKSTVTPVCGAAGTYTLNPASGNNSGGSYSSPTGFPETAAIFIIGATTGDKFTAETW